MRFSLRYVYSRRQRLGDAFYLGDTLLLATAPFLATPRLGDAFFVAMHVAASNRKKIKTKNQGKGFLKLVFPFIRVTSLKNPGKGKRASPFTILLHCCLHKSTKIKLQVGCIPTARDGTPLQGL